MLTHGACRVARAGDGRPRHHLSQLRTIPVVVMASSREEPDIAECYKLGVNSCIVKPVDFDQFTEAVGGVGLCWLLLNQLPTLSARGVNVP